MDENNIEIVWVKKKIPIDLEELQLGDLPLFANLEFEYLLMVSKFVRNDK